MPWLNIQGTRSGVMKCRIQKLGLFLLLISIQCYSTMSSANPSQRNLKESAYLQHKNVQAYLQHKHVGGMLGYILRRLENAMARSYKIEKGSAQGDEGFSFVPLETKRVDGSMLKLKLRQPNRPPVTLDQINHLAIAVCPQMMVTVHSSVIAQICSQIKVLQEKMSLEELANNHVE